MKHKTLYIHVGFHKTGTTSIQNWCEENREFLKFHDLDYVKSHCVSANHAAYALCLNPKLVHKCRNTSLFLGLKEENRYNNETKKAHTIYSTLNRYIAESNSSKILISSECFLEQVDLVLLATIIKEMEVNVKFIFYLRPQISWINSVYSYVIMDKDLRFSGSINQLPQLSMLDYNSVIETFITHFSKNSIILKNYNKSVIDGNSLITDFLNNMIDLNSADINTTLDANKKDNESLNSVEIKCLNLLWRLERFTKIRLKKLEALIFSRRFKNLSHKPRFKVDNMQQLSISNQALFKKFPKLEKFKVDE